MYIERNPEKIEQLKETTGWSVANCLWPSVRRIMNRANKDMAFFLTDNFDVKEFHPFVEQFNDSNTPEDLVCRLKSAMEKKDNELFKKETVRSNTEELAAERQVDACEPRTLKEL